MSCQWIAGSDPGKRGIPGAAEKAYSYLEKAARENSEDAEILSALGFTEQQRGHDKQAQALYEPALKLKPDSNTAAVNLGALEAKSGNLRRAVELWQQAFRRVPYESAIGMNLALAFCTSGQLDEARRDELRVLEFNPDDAKARRLWTNLNSDPPRCKD